MTNFLALKSKQRATETTSEFRKASKFKIWMFTSGETYSLLVAIATD